MAIRDRFKQGLLPPRHLMHYLHVFTENYEWFAPYLINFRQKESINRLDIR
jgi:hypothetical protein